MTNTGLSAASYKGSARARVANLQDAVIHQAAVEIH